MAKEYKGKITLQDNFTDVISKAIKQTQQLQKEFKKIEKLKANPKVSVDIDENAMAIAKKDLAKLSKNKVKVKTTLDSSFNSTMNTINKATAQNKTIKITAEENVTRTVKNLQRDIFTVERKLKTSILGGGRFSGSGFSGNITTSSPDIVSTLNQGFSKLIKGNTNRTNVSNNEAGSLIRDLVSNGFGTSLAMGLAGLTGATIKRLGIGRGNKGNDDDDNGIKIPEVDIGESIGKITSKIAAKMDFRKWLTGKEEGVAPNQYLKDFGLIGSMQKGFDDETGLYKLIKQQKEYMKALKESQGIYGSKNSEYLPKYRYGAATILDSGEYNNGKAWRTKNGPHNIDGNITMEFYVKDTKFSQQLSKIRDKAKDTFNRMKLNATITGNYMSQKLSNGIQTTMQKFPRLTHSAKYSFNQIKNFAQVASTKAKFSMERMQYHGILSFMKLSTAAKPLLSVFGKLATPLGKALKMVGKLATGVAKVAAKATRIAFNMTGNALKFSAQVLANVTKAVAAAAGGLVFKGVMDGALNEQYEVSMLHFIENAGGSVEDRDKYMNDAIKLANKTPFSTNEVLEAANRGIGVAGGNTQQASDLLKLAADMAALTPGKTVMDAMEALADLKLGERERMKEFGFKIDNDEFVKAAGLSSGNISDLTPEQMEKAFATLTDGKTGAVGKYFEGGAAKIADTFKGQISTLTGQFGSAFADLGRVITQPLMEPLKTVNSKLEKFATSMKDLKDGVLSGAIPNPFTKWQEFLNWADKGVNMHNPIAKFALTIAPAVSTVVSLITMLKNSFESVFGRIKVALQQAYKPFDDLFGAIEQRAPWAQGIFDVLANVVAVAMEVIGSVMQNAYEIVKPILEWIGEHSEQISNIFTVLGQIAQMCCEFISSAFQILWPIVEPILSGILDLLNWIAEGLINDFPEAAKAVDKFGKDVAEFLQPAIDAFKSVWDWCGKALGKVGEWMQNGYNNVVGNVKDFFGGDDYNKNGRAVGQSYVPYNGYKASLHRGEAILTRQEADAWRAGRTSGGNNNNTTQNITINVNGAADANVVAKKVAMELQKVAMNM